MQLVSSYLNSNCSIISMYLIGNWNRMRAIESGQISIKYLVFH